MRVVQHVASRIEADNGIALKWGSRVDLNMALLQRKPIFVEGKKIGAEPYVDDANGIARDSVDLVLTRVANVVDRLQMIIVAGGHPEYYAEYLREKLPNMPIIETGMGRFGNAIGFLFSGEETLRRDQEAA